MSRSVVPAARPVARTRGGTQPVPLGLDDIVSAALAVVERGGLAPLSLKSVADEIGVTSPAIYHYVQGKDDLVKRVCERVASLVRLDTDPAAPWQDQVVAIMVGMHHTFARFPGVGTAVLSLPGPAPAATAIAARVIEIICGAGISEHDAVRINTAMHFYFSGWLLGRPPFLPAPAGRRRNDVPRTTDVMTIALLEEGLRFLLAGFSGTRAPAAADV